MKMIGVVRTQPPPVPLKERIEQNDFVVGKGDDVVGRLALIKLEKEDTLPDIARHFSLGGSAVGAANPGVDVWVPEAGKHILLPLSFILPDTLRKGIVINLAAMRLFHFKEDDKELAVSTYPVGIGTVERPSPLGRMYIQRKMYQPIWHVPASIAEDHRKKGDPLPPKVLPGPLNPLGEYALYLSKGSYLIHGTNKPASIGLSATNGCIRLYPEDIKRLFENTPIRTSVSIVRQPYLVGLRDGVVYLEAHTPPPEEVGTGELDKAFAKLRSIAKESGGTLDWEKIKRVIVEARGYPVPVFEVRQGSKENIPGIVELRHPDKLYGKPEVPELKPDGWNVLAATVRDKTEAMRLAAIINHQGPPIPARVLSNGEKQRVLAGPFVSAGEAKEAVRRLKIDLEIDATLVEPFPAK